MCNGIMGTWTGYPIQIVETKPGDIIFCHISDDLDFQSCEYIFKELKSSFPDNTVLLANEHLFKGINIIRPEEKLISFKTDKDIDKIFDKIEGAHTNDFLY